MKKRIALWAVLLICSALLTGCGERLTSGTVLQKKYTPRKTHLQMTPVFAGGSVVILPQTMIVPSTFRLLVHGKNETGETVAEWWNVSEAQYNAAEIGKEVYR